MKLIASIIITGLVVSCSPVHPIETLSSTQISSKSEVTHDAAKQATLVEGLKLVFGEFKENSYLLRATRAEREPIVHYYLFMQTLRKQSLGGAGWKTALEEQGTSFPLVKETKETNVDILFESVTFELPRDWLNQAALQEIKVRIAGAVTNQVLVFPTNYVAGFVNRVDQEFFLKTK